MKQWQISELEIREGRDIFNKNILFHFCDEVADRVEKWLEAIGVSNTARFEDCRTNHFFYIVNCTLMYVNTDFEEEIMYLLDNDYSVIEITEDKING
jgi:hypothetical protein